MERSWFLPLYPPVTSHSWQENGPKTTMSFLLNMGIFQPAMLVLPNLPISSKNGQFGLLQKSSQFLESTAIIFWGSLPHVYGWNWVSLADNSSSFFVFLQSIKDPGNLPPGKLTWQWKMDPEWRCIFLLNMVIFHCHVSLLEGTFPLALNIYRKTTPFDPRVYHLHSYDQGNELLAVEVCPNTLEMRCLGKLPMVF